MSKLARFADQPGRTAPFGVGLQNATALVLAFAAFACGSSTDSGAPEPPHPCYQASQDSCAEPQAGALGDTERANCEAAALATCSTDYYLRGYPQLQQTNCGSTPGSEQTLDAEVSLELFRAPGLSDDTTADQTRGLQRWWEPHALWFSTPAPSQRTAMVYALSGSRAKLTAALNQAGINVNQSSLSPAERARAEEVVANVMFGPIRSFLSFHAQPKIQRVNVVILHRIISPGLESLLNLDGEVAGLALSPALLAEVSTSDSDADLYKAIGMSGDFTPTLFVGADTVDRYLPEPDKVIAHEMGHALGLVHTYSVGNLMTQGLAGSCRPHLDDDQIGKLQLPVSTPRDGYEQVREIPGRAVRALLQPSD